MSATKMKSSKREKITFSLFKILTSLSNGITHTKMSFLSSITDGTFHTEWTMQKIILFKDSIKTVFDKKPEDLLFWVFLKLESIFTPRTNFQTPWTTLIEVKKQCLTHWEWLSWVFRTAWKHKTKGSRNALRFSLKMALLKKMKMVSG